MLKRFFNKLRAYNSVLKVLYTYKDVWTANIGFTEVVTDLEADVKAIDTAQSEAGVETNGITDDKNTLASEIIDIMIEISGSFGAMAKRMDNNELRGKVVFTESDMVHMLEEDFAKKAVDFAKLAKQYAPQLAKYEITAEEIDDLEGLATDYSQKIHEPRHVVSVRSAVNKRIRVMFGATNLLLREQMDGVVNRYRRSHPDFWNAYYSARHTIEYGTRHEPPVDGAAGNGGAAK